MHTTDKISDKSPEIFWPKAERNVCGNERNQLAAMCKQQSVCVGDFEEKFRAFEFRHVYFEFFLSGYF